MQTDNLDIPGRKIQSRGRVEWERRDFYARLLRYNSATLFLTSWDVFEAGAPFLEDFLLGLALSHPLTSRVPPHISSSFLFSLRHQDSDYKLTKRTKTRLVCNFGTWLLDRDMFSAAFFICVELLAPLWFDMHDMESVVMKKQLPSEFLIYAEFILEFTTITVL